jgi:adenylosuccinate synthase
MSNVIILGAQWGDEGKGKVVDLFSERFDIVARYQGGHNAGHTVRVGDRKMVLKLVPSGILRPGKTAVIGNGVVIDPAALLEEITALEAAGVDVTGRLFISNRAHVILPFHRMMERLSESRPDRAIGTTARGIGPCYEDKIARRGVRVSDLIDADRFRTIYDSLVQDKEVLRVAFGLGEPPDWTAAREEYVRHGERIAPMVRDTALLLNESVRAGKRVLFEGAQGTMLDIDHGTYPFVTSSSAGAGGACTGTGMPPNRIDAILGVSKAYITRVGHGPFPTEDKGAAGERLREKGSEFGAVTGRPRRCGWFDVPLLRYTAMINGFDSLIITKLDVLDGLKEIPVCVGYKLCGRPVDSMPATNEQIEALEPIYETLPGWTKPTAGTTRYEDLPAEARNYLAFLSEKTGVEAGAVSTGPDRSEMIVVPGSRFEKLMA